jgi:hypothetical protein
MNEEEMWTICCVHNFLFSRLSQLPWYSGSPPDLNNELDMVGMVSAGYQVTADVIADYGHLMGNVVHIFIIFALTNFFSYR